ncbi:hypothetical protein OF83DRAFT_1178798 [Amylostereum chailletii]|nr:hypothetical protein OF83DRAFT_1178798 [Amylostereum chailletii]
MPNLESTSDIPAISPSGTPLTVKRTWLSTPRYPKKEGKIPGVGDHRQYIQNHGAIGGRGRSEVERNAEWIAAFGELSAFSETWKSVWDKVGTCVQLVDGIAEIHPYASIAWSVLSFVPRALSVQATRDRNIIELLAAIDDAYSFVQQAVNLKNREEPLVIYQNKVLADIMRQTTECAYFILDYAKDSSFWKRATKNAVISEADARTQEYLRKLKELKEAFENRAVLNTEISVLRVMDITRDIANDIKEHDMDSKLNAIPYAGAHFQWDRRCLPGTRKAFLEKIEEWVNDPNDSHRVSIIFGLAGTGKSSIAHETAHRFEKLKRLGSSFRFDRADQAAAPSAYFPT